MNNKKGLLIKTGPVVVKKIKSLFSLPTSSLHLVVMGDEHYL
jgi:hypothetical protein